MKTKNTKSILFILLVLFLSSTSHAQNNTLTYEITFTSSGQSDSVESIIVVNTTQRESVTLSGTDTLHLVKTVGLKPNHGSNAAFKVFPNPTNYSSRIEFFNALSGNVSLEFLDFSGKVLKAYTYNLPQGIHAFEIEGLGVGVFLLKIRTQKAIYVERLVSYKQAFGQQRLQYLGMMNHGHRHDIEKSSRNVIMMDYFDGEKLLITGVSGFYKKTFSVIPNESQNVDIEFVECIDSDGNNYGVVTIGEQVWMDENLKTTKYINDYPIEYPGNNNSEWENNTIGAYAWYFNDINLKDSYGALYNWHAVNHNHGLCPTGWHVPSDAEWTQLVDYVVAQGFPNLWEDLNGAGNALKSCRQVNSPLEGDCNTSQHPRWHSYNTHHGFDEFGFLALPGGLRNYDGYFYSYGYNSIWWSSTESDTTNAWERGLGYNNGSVHRGGDQSKVVGFSVRCLKD